MFKWFKSLDEILRGKATQRDQLLKQRLEIPVFGIVVVIIVLGLVAGACTGSFALIRGFESSEPEVMQSGWQQILASSLKVPALFLLTLLITFPSLYVFNALIGSQLGISSTLKLLIAALGVNLAVLASLGPIVAFFSASTPSYPFIVLLNVASFAVAGFLSLAFLFQTLRRMSPAPPLPPRTTGTWQQPVQNYGHPHSVQQGAPIEQMTIENVDNDRGSSEIIDAEMQGQDESSDNDVSANAETRLEHETPGPIRTPQGTGLGKHVRTIFCCWVVVYGLVGAQMGWVLRPFIGTPDKEFQWFRQRDGSFFEGVMHSIQNLFG